MALQRLLCLAAGVAMCHGVIAGPLSSAGAGPAQHVIQLQRPAPPPAAFQNEEKEDLAAPASAAAPRRGLHGRFLHITDLHPDAFYKLHSSTEEIDACHRGNGPAGTYGAETSDCDSPFSLINATFDWIDEHLKDQIDFVVWTGDSARHDSDEELPRDEDQVLGTNRWIADKFVTLLSDDKRGNLAVPVVPTFGNNDILPHNILLPGPNKWLRSYANIWRRFVPEEQRHSFEFGGWFYVEAVPNKLAVFSLNTLYFFDRNAGVDDCATPTQPGFKQMEWLRVQLQFMRERGMKAILTGHVPPARTDSKMLWDETCWQKYTLWLQQYRDVVVGGVFGHMNIDHFLLQDTKEIDVALLQAAARGEDISSFDAVRTREAMEDELSIESTADYLQELRSGWAKLPDPVVWDVKDGKKGSKKKRKNRFAERYQLTLISPSVVPNYFPTLRVVEYNITGLEDTETWAEAAATGEPFPILHDEKEEEDSQDTLELRRVAEDESPGATKKNGKGKKPKDPFLIIPKPPKKSALPGPAYANQPFTFTGYTQYFANLTHINNDMTPPSNSSNPGAEPEGQSWSDWLQRWREGKHRDKTPKQPGSPKPRKFKFEVEYSTLKDKLFGLDDLTVKNMVKLAYRMGQKDKKATAVLSPDDMLPRLDGEEDNADETPEIEELDEESDDESDDDDEFGVDKKKKKKGSKLNKTWLHFLQHAFVGTVDKEELIKYA